MARVDITWIVNLPAFKDGMRAAAPAVPANLPFGFVFGTTAVVGGLSPFQATAMSVLTIAGTAQLAALELLQDGASIPVIVATALFINFRFVVFSMSLTPYVSDLSRRWRAVIALPLIDITYALAVARFENEDGLSTDVDDGASGDEHTGNTTPDAGSSTGSKSNRSGTRRTLGAAERDEPVHRGWYYLGVALPLAGSFVGSTVVGVLVGQTIGTGLHLDFVVPLLFLAVLVPTIDSPAATLAAGVAAVAAVVAAGLPFNLGLLVGLSSGTAAGTLVDHTRFAGGTQ